MNNLKKLDPSILSFVPRDTYYLSLEEQLKSIESSWELLLNSDRELFALLMILPGTNYAKGRMIHYLTSTTENYSDRSSNSVRTFSSIDPLLEDEIIMYNLKQMPMASAIRALTFLAGEDYAGRKLKRVNNTRARRIIMTYIFDRDDKSLEAMAVKFKSKLARLIRHTFGNADLHKVFSDDNDQYRLFHKYCRHAITNIPFDTGVIKTAISFVFNKYEDPIISAGIIQDYEALKQSAKANNVEVFKSVLETSNLPYEIALGFRNFYKLDVDLKFIHEKGKKSEQAKFSTMESAKRHGAEKTEVDFTKQSLKNLYKYIYFKYNDNEKLVDEEYEKLVRAIEKGLEKESKLNVDLGKVVVIVDSSDSMRGHKTRPYHPIITAMLTVNKLPNVGTVIFSGANKFALDPKGNTNILPLVEPVGGTELWNSLLHSVELKPDTVIVISDGYENTIEGMFEHIYKYLEDLGYKFKLIHINPVYDSSKGGRHLVKDIDPICISEPEMFETSYILTMVGQDIVNVKKLLAGIFNKKLGGEKRELLIEGKV